VGFGNFDGVHLGHRALIDELRRLAGDLPGGVTLVTFWPHPLTVLRPADAPPMVDTLHGRLHWLERCGVDRVLVLQFDRQLAARPAEWFARDVLFGALGGAVVVAGEDARFGRRGQGDLNLLRHCAGEFDARVQIFEQIVGGAAPISSSRIRRLIAGGDARGSTRLLGRPFCLRGEIVRGDAIGGKIGFPTANLEAPQQVRPGAGVYATRLEVGEQLLDAVTNVGTRPTMAGDQWRVETHVPGWTGDLYGQQVSLHLVARIRDERRFEGVDALRAQIGRDCQTAMELLAADATSCT